MSSLHSARTEVLQLLHRFRAERGRQNRAQRRVLRRIELERRKAHVRLPRDRDGLVGKALVVTLHDLDVFSAHCNPVAAVMRCPEDIGRTLHRLLPRQVHIVSMPGWIHEIEVEHQHAVRALESPQQRKPVFM